MPRLPSQSTDVSGADATGWFRTPARSSRSLQATRTAVQAGALALLLAGCRTDPSQQLLERELRMQEDQIYHLQDELEAKCARLERVAGENVSMRRQLGFVDHDPPGFTRPATPGQPTLVPPPLTIPAAPSTSGGAAGPGRLPPPIGSPSSPAAAPGGVAPPALEGVPPLPAEPRFPGAAVPPAPAVVPTAATVPVAADFDPSARPMAPDTPPATGRQLSHEESLAEAGRITHLVVNQSRTACFDGTADGVSDGLAVVIEPRDDDERLVSAAGDVAITVFDDRGETVARWDVPAQEAATHFRRTSRNRGLHFVLRWPGPPPSCAAVRIHVALTAFDGTVHETDCTVAARPAAADGPQ